MQKDFNFSVVSRPSPLCYNGNSYDDTSGKVAIFQMMVSVSVFLAKLMVGFKNNLISAKTSLSQRSIVNFDLKKENLKLKQYASTNTQPEKDLRTAIASKIEENELEAEKIIKKPTAYNTYNKIFDVSVYSLVPTVVIGLIALMAGIATGESICALIFIAAALGVVFATQASSLGLLYREHKAIDSEMQKAVTQAIGSIENQAQANSNLGLQGARMSEEATVNDPYNFMNLTIAIRDLNLVRIRNSIDEYNKKIVDFSNYSTYDVSSSNALQLMDTELVGNLIVILGSLFITEDNYDRCCDDYDAYAKATKGSILKLLNTPNIDVLTPLIGSLSGNRRSNKKYELLKLAIIAKLSGLASSGDNFTSLPSRCSSFQGLPPSYEEACSGQDFNPGRYGQEHYTRYPSYYHNNQYDRLQPTAPPGYEL